MVCSQDYEKTLIEGNKWDVTHVFGMGGVTKFTEIVGCDTLIEENIYSIVTRYYYANEIIGSEVSRAYLREDTINKQVFRLENANDIELLILEYSLNVGDSMFIYDEYYPVVDVSYETWFGEERRTLYIGTSFEFVEGIGFNPYGVSWGDNETAAWGFSNIGKTCEGSVSTAEIDVNVQYEVFPNPSDGYVELGVASGYNKRTNVEVLDLKGRTILKRELQDDLIIDLSEFQSGMYIISINGVKKKVIKM